MLLVLSLAGGCIGEELEVAEAALVTPNRAGVIRRTGRIDTGINLGSAEIAANDHMLAVRFLAQYPRGPEQVLVTNGLTGAGEYTVMVGSMISGNRPDPNVYLTLRVGTTTVRYLAPSWTRPPYFDGNWSSAAPPPVVEEWHHLAVTAIGGLGFMVHLDGAPALALGPPVFPLASLGGTLALGQHPAPDDPRQFYGLVDDLAVYSPHKTSAEIATLAATKRLSITETKLIDWVGFDVASVASTPTGESWVATVSPLRNGTADLAVLPMPFQRSRLEVPFAAGQHWQVIQEFASNYSHRDRSAFALDLVRKDAATIGSGVLAPAAGTIVERGVVSPTDGTRMTLGIGTDVSLREHVDFEHLEAGSELALGAVAGIQAPLATVGNISNYHLHVGFNGPTSSSAPSMTVTAPMAFAHYERSRDYGATWQFVIRGIPRWGEWIRRSATLMMPVSAWPDGDIPVCFESAGFATEKAWVRDVVRTTWEAEANLEFTGWGQCSSATSSGIRIGTGEVIPGTVTVGYGLNNVPNGMTLNFGPTGGCAVSASREQCIRVMAAHQFGHALGFAHQLNLVDAPNLCPAAEPDSHGDTGVGAWDLMSIPSYCNPSSNSSGLPSGGEIAMVQNRYGARQPIAVVAWDTGKLDAFVRSTDGMLGTTLSSPLPWFGGPLTGAPSAVSRSSGRIDVFMRAPDGSLQTKWWIGGFSPPGMGALGTEQIVGSPVAVSRAADRIDVVVRGPDHRLMVRSWDGANWSGYVALLGGTRVVGTPAVVALSGTIHVLARGADGALWTATFSGGAWSTMSQRGTNQFVGDPVAVVTAPDQITVVVRGTDDALYQKRLWQGVWDASYEQIASNPIRGNPVAAAWGLGRLDIFVRGTDGMLYTINWNGSAWSNYIWLSGPILASPTVISLAPNQLQLFVRGTDSALYKKAGNGVQWSSFSGLGQSFR